MSDAALEDLLDELLSSDEDENSPAHQKEEPALATGGSPAKSTNVAKAAVNPLLPVSDFVGNKEEQQREHFIRNAAHLTKSSQSETTRHASVEPAEPGTGQYALRSFQPALYGPASNQTEAPQTTPEPGPSSLLPSGLERPSPSPEPAAEPGHASQLQSSPKAESESTGSGRPMTPIEGDLQTLSTDSLDVTDKAALLAADKQVESPMPSLSGLSARPPNAPSTQPSTQSLEAQPTEPIKQAHVTTLELAEAVERDLATGRGISGLKGDQAGPTDPADSLRLRLQWSREEWSAEGQPDSRGGLIGGRLLVRADLAGPLDDAVQEHRAYGDARSVAVLRGVLAVGMSSGVSFVLMPRGISQDGATKGQAEVLQLGQPHGKEESAVTCLAFSIQGNLLAVGHADGDLSFWEFRRAAWECVKTIKDVHVTPVVQAAFLEGPQITAVTADSRGRLVHHNVTGYLSLTAMFAGRLAKGTQPALLTEGRQLGPLCHLAGLPAPKPGTAHQGDVGRSHFMQDGAAQHVWDGMLIMCSTKGAYVGKVSLDGRLGVLHSIPRPPEAPEGCLPYSAWRLLPLQPSARYAEAHLVMGWAKRLFLLEVPIPLLPAAGEPLPAEKPPLKVLRQWEVAQPVSGIHWLDGPALAVITQEGPHAYLSLFDLDGEVLREHLALGDPLLRHSDIVGQHGIAEACHHNTSAASGGGIVLLGNQGVKLARLMTWQERLAGLRDISQWELALLTGLDILQATSSVASNAEPTRLWRGEGRGAEAHQVADALAKLLGGYLAAALPSSEQGMGTAAHMQASAAADVAIELCMTLGKPSLLWADVFPRFRVAGYASVLLEHLLPHILQDHMTALAPEMMQALVEHCAREGRPEAVEAAVMHMDLASLDLNQVVRLCRQHHLYSALAFLYPRALLDFIAPAAELMVAIAYANEEAPAPCPEEEHSWNEHRQLAFKLLVYLRTCFQGLSFPPGSGMLEPSQVPETQAQLLGFLLYGTPGFIERLLQAFGAEESAGLAGALDELLPGPYPVLRCLVSTDAGATLLVLREALVGCSLTDAALRAAVHAKHAASDEVLAEQAVLDAVVSLLDAGAFRRPDSSGGQRSTSEDGSVFHALVFISETVAEGRVTAAASVIMKLLQWLALGPWCGGKAPPLDQQEQQFIALLQHLDLRAGRASNLSGLSAIHAQSLAKQAGFLKAEAQVHHLAGNHAAALHCFLRTSPEAAFDYLDAALVSPNTSQAESASIWAALQAALQELVEADSLVLARLVLKHFPDQHAGIIHSLQSAPELQFRYLKGAMQAGQEGEGSSLRGEQGIRLLPLAAKAGQGLQAEAQASELYIRLLCQFDPAAVLPFLMSHEAYRVQEVLPFCQEHGVLDAEAFLLERLGDVTAALEIYARQLEQAMRALTEAVLSGRIHVASLPGVGHSRTSHSRLLGHRRRVTQGPTDLPKEVTGATEALRAAVALCQRHSLDASPQVTQQLWLHVLRGYVTLLRELRAHCEAEPPQRKKAEVKRAGSRGLLAWPQGGGRKDQLKSLKEAAAMQRQEEAAEEVAPVIAVQRLLMHFMEDIIADMAGYVPLSAIGERILAEFASDQFGDFKGSLVGLLGAYNYELSILQAANRLMASDAFRILYADYRSRSRSLAVEAVRQAVQAMLDADYSMEASAPSRRPASLGSPPEHLASSMMRAEPSWSSSGFEGGAQNSPAVNRPAKRSSGTGMLVSGEAGSPMHRSGCDINFLRAHGLRSMAAGD